MLPIVKFFASALLQLRAELKENTHYVKPQFLIDDDDEHQDALEASWDNDEKYDEIREIDEILEGHEQFTDDSLELGMFIVLAANKLKANGYRISIRKP